MRFTRFSSFTDINVYSILPECLLQIGNQILRQQDVVSRLEQLEHCIDGSHAGAEGPCLLALFQGGDGFLQVVPGRVAAAAIVITCALLKAWMPEGGRLINRLAQGASIVCLPTAMNLNSKIMHKTSSFL